MIQQKCVHCSFARPCGDFFNTSPHPLFMYSWECGFVTGSDKLKQKSHRGKGGVKAEVTQVCDHGLQQHLHVDLGEYICKAKRERSRKRTPRHPRVSPKQASFGSLNRTHPRSEICFQIFQATGHSTILQSTAAGMTPPLLLGGASGIWSLPSGL